MCELVTAEEQAQLNKHEQFDSAVNLPWVFQLPNQNGP